MASCADDAVIKMAQGGIEKCQIVNLLQTDGAFVAIGLGVAGAVAGVVSRAGLHSVMEYAGIGVAAGALLASITTVGGLIGVGVLIG